MFQWLCTTVTVFQIYNYVPHRTFMRTLNIHEINENKIHIKGI